MPQYYDMHDDPLNRNRPNPFNDLNKMHPGDARRFQAELSHAMDPGLQQGPRMHNPLIDPRVNSAGLANIDPAVAKAIYRRDMLPRETAGLEFLQAQNQPGTYNPLIAGDLLQNDLNALNLDKVRAQVRDVYTASDFVGGPPGNAAEMLMGQPKRPHMGRRRGETADGAILQEILRRRRGR